MEQLRKITFIKQQNLIANFGEHASVVDLPALFGVKTGPIQQECAFLARFNCVHKFGANSDALDFASAFLKIFKNILKIK